MTVSERQARPAEAEAEIWQRVEFGSYVADLPVWEQVAAGNDPVLELGAGAGRVALHLARRGADVVALDRDETLLAALRERAGASELAVRTVVGDAAEIRALWPLSDPPGSVLGPLHLVQELEPEPRRTLLETLADVCRPGAAIGLSVVDERSLFEGGIEGGAIPDMVEIGDWVYSSEPLWVQVSDEAIRVRRLRQRVAPDGAIERSVHDELLHRLDPNALEAEAEAAGLVPRERRAIRSGPAEADSIAVILEAR